MPDDGRSESRVEQDAPRIPLARVLVPRDLVSLLAGPICAICGNADPTIQKAARAEPFQASTPPWIAQAELGHPRYLSGAISWFKGGIGRAVTTLVAQRHLEKPRADLYCGMLILRVGSDAARRDLI